MQVPPFHTLPERCEFYLVRHGESVSNSDGRIQGHTDSPLSEIGRGHAEAAGRWFSDRRIDAVLASPLARAYETARIIAHHAGAPVPEREPDLMELDTGIYSDVRISELRDVDPELYRDFRVHSWEVVPEAERIESLLARTRRVWERLVGLAHEGHRRMVCVTHGGALQWMIKSTIGSDEQRWMPLFPAGNCGIFLFSAESTLRDATEPPAPGTGYYGVWELVNHVPY